MVPASVVDSSIRSPLVRIRVCCFDVGPGASIPSALIRVDRELEIEKHALATERGAQWRPVNDRVHVATESREPYIEAGFTLPLLCVGEHLQGGVFEIDNAGKIEHHDPRVSGVDQRPDLLCDPFGIEEEDSSFEVNDQ